MLPFPPLIGSEFELSLEFNKTCLIMKGGKAENIPLPCNPHTQPAHGNKSILEYSKTNTDIYE